MAQSNIPFLTPSDLEELINNNPVWLADDEDGKYEVIR